MVERSLGILVIACQSHALFNHKNSGKCGNSQFCPQIPHHQRLGRVGNLGQSRMESYVTMG
eukprot:475313-Amphidinium_carterae.1